MDSLRSGEERAICQRLPSIEYNKFQPYSACGRLTTALSLLEGRTEVTDRTVGAAFKCGLCGLCDVSCKICRYDMEPLESMHELRFHLVEAGHAPAAHEPVLEHLRKEHNMAGRPKTERGAWPTAWRSGT